MSNVVSPAATVPTQGRASRGIGTFVVGQAISLVGSEVSVVALPIVAVIVLGLGPADLGLMTVVSFVPALAAPFYAGVIADRYSRRTTLIVCDVVRAATLAALVGAYAADVLSLPLLLFLLFLRGLVATIFDATYFAYLPDIVEKERLTAINGQLASVQSGSSIIGGAAGGALAGVMGVMVLAIDAVSYLVSAVTLLPLRSLPRPERSAKGEGYLESIRVGIRAVWTNPPVRLLGFTSAAFNFFSAAEGAMLVLFALRTLQMNPGLVGVTLACGALGGLVTGFCVSPLVKRLGNHVVLIGGLGLAALGSVAISGTTRTGAAIILSVVLFGQTAGAVCYMVVNASIRQALVPNELRGRVFASLRMIGRGVLPFGAMIAGTVAAITSIRLAIVVAAIGEVLVVVWLFSGRRVIPKTLDSH